MFSFNDLSGEKNAFTGSVWRNADSNSSYTTCYRLLVFWRFFFNASADILNVSVEQNKVYLKFSYYVSKFWIRIHKNVQKFNNHWISFFFQSKICLEDHSLGIIRNYILGENYVSVNCLSFWTFIHLGQKQWQQSLL